MTQHTPIEINVRQENGAHIFDVHGRLTIGDSSDQLIGDLPSSLPEWVRKVINDLNDGTQMDSSGISTLFRMPVSLGRDGAPLHLVCKLGCILDAPTVTR